MYAFKILLLVCPTKSLIKLNLFGFFQKICKILNMRNYKKINVLSN